MSTTTGAISAGTNNAPSTQTGGSRKRRFPDSEDTSERDEVHIANKRTKAPEPHRSDSSKEKKRRSRKKKKPQSVVEHPDGRRVPVSPVPGMSTPKSPRKRSRSAARKSVSMPVAGPSSGLVAATGARQSTPDIASSSTVKMESLRPTPAPSSPIASVSKGKEKATVVDVKTLDGSALSAELAELKTQLAAKNEVLSHQRTLLSTLQGSLTCQICLDPLHKPYALAPCGHVACYSCLVAWFQAPPPDAHPHDVLPVLLRKKTCPHCRAVLRERPIEVWAVKDMVSNFLRSGLGDPPMNPPPAAPPPDPNANGQRADPWDGIFRKPLAAAGGVGAPLFFPDPPPAAALHEMLGMHDAEDGGIYRCVDCGHEIWDGVCSACAREYPGHVHGHLGWDVEDSEDDEEGADDGLGLRLGGWHGMVFGRGGAPWEWDFGAGEEDDDEDDEDTTDVDGGEDNGGNHGPYGFAPILRGRFFGGQADASAVDDLDEGGDEEGEEDEAGYESSFIDDEGADAVDVPARRSFREMFAENEGWGADVDSGQEDEAGGEGGGGEEMGEDDVPPHPLRRHRFVVQSDDEEDGQSAEEGVHSGGGLAEAVAERERIIYGDDGSIPRADLRSSSPVEVYSDPDSTVHRHSYPAYDDEEDEVSSDVWGDHHEGDDGPVWGDDGESHHAYDEESLYSDGEDVSGDEYEYSDAVW
ncbi:hypothetical protein DAEQUDRAFT_732632 [Daedalea quercina L-15889]|uniref:RING-type domain-containing protein n=1 Tax=Daedalea quercina L-15889 TaxID=1314783 RepID=A0A165LH43_9APHY|nr:hypothetical protein DAEQUDRAFT_732632 [Daedalea quercina L-15889]